MLTRAATPDDATDLARLADMAGEGLPAHVWAEQAGPGETAHEVGRRRALRDKGAFSWRNAVIAELEGQVAGALVGYRIAEPPQPLDGLPPAFRNLQALENMVPGAHYVNVLAVYPAFRGRGVARQLLAEAEARAAPGQDLAIIVADRNAPALALYVSEGFAERARLPLVRPPGWECESRAWVLLTKGRGLAKRADPA